MHFGPTRDRKQQRTYLKISSWCVVCVVQVYIQVSVNANAQISLTIVAPKQTKVKNIYQIRKHARFSILYIIFAETTNNKETFRLQ